MAEHSECLPFLFDAVWAKSEVQSEAALEKIKQLWGYVEDLLSWADFSQDQFAKDWLNDLYYIWEPFVQYLIKYGKDGGYVRENPDLRRITWLSASVFSSTKPADEDIFGFLRNRLKKNQRTEMNKFCAFHDILRSKLLSHGGTGDAVAEDKNKYFLPHMQMPARDAAIPLQGQARAQDENMFHMPADHKVHDSVGLEDLQLRIDNGTADWRPAGPDATARVISASILLHELGPLQAYEHAADSKWSFLLGKKLAYHDSRRDIVFVSLGSGKYAGFGWKLDRIDVGEIRYYKPAFSDCSNLVKFQNSHADDHSCFRGICLDEMPPCSMPSSIGSMVGYQQVGGPVSLVEHGIRSVMFMSKVQAESLCAELHVPILKFPGLKNNTKLLFVTSLVHHVLKHEQPAVKQYCIDALCAATPRSHSVSGIDEDALAAIDSMSPDDKELFKETRAELVHAFSAKVAERPGQSRISHNYYTAQCLVDLIPQKGKLKSVSLVDQRSQKLYCGYYQGASPLESTSMRWGISVGGDFRTETMALTEVVQWLWKHHVALKNNTPEDVMPDLVCITRALEQRDHEMQGHEIQMIYKVFCCGCFKYEYIYIYIYRYIICKHVYIIL